MEERRAAYPISEFSALYGNVSQRTIMRKIKAGEIRTIRCGRRVLIPRSELERLTKIEGVPLREGQ